MNYKIKDFIPLIIIFLTIITLSILHQIQKGWDVNLFMLDFMGLFFLIFGIFKVYNLKEFAEAYSTYDIIAKQYSIYAYVYPFIEIFLGICFLFKFNIKMISLLSLIIMIISIIGVTKELLKKNQITCACLGLVFKIPMTYVTFFEDLLMIMMTLIMLIK